MAITRRRVMQLSAGGALALAVGGRAALAGDDPVAAVRDNALGYFGGRGYGEAPPLGMLTGAEFNGGLRYDESRAEPPSEPAMAVQPSARIEDIPQRTRPGVLAGFTIFGLSRPAPADPAAFFTEVLDFLVEERRLDPKRMLFVSTERFRPLVDQIERVDAGQVFERDMAEAMAAGDGSGYFAPAGHPQAPKMLSVGVHYRLPGAAAGGEVAYPPQDHIEIAEIGIAPPEGAHDASLGAGIGLERVAMAEGEAVPDFEETRLNLLRIIEEEARRTGKDLPPGYTMFASL